MLLPSICHDRTPASHIQFSDRSRSCLPCAEDENASSSAMNCKRQKGKSDDDL